MTFLNLEGKIFVVMGVANRRSVAYAVARMLLAEQANVILSVRSEARRAEVSKLLPECEIHVCDVEKDDQIAALANSVGEKHRVVSGLIHSIAFADYENFSGKFHEVSRADFLRCVSISCYSFVALANVFREILEPRASMVTISISTTRMAVEAYGYMAPAKAALDSSLTFLAKSFSRFSQVRFNAVAAGLLKTSASAGIPGYAEHYMFAEQVIPRKSGLTTDEVASTALFLLSDRSSGINAQTVVVDAGMGINYFDTDVVRHTLRGVWPTDKS